MESQHTIRRVFTCLFVALALIAPGDGARGQTVLNEVEKLTELLASEPDDNDRFGQGVSSR